MAYLRTKKGQIIKMLVIASRKRSSCGVAIPNWAIIFTHRPLKMTIIGTLFELLSEGQKWVLT